MPSDTRSRSRRDRRNGPDTRVRRMEEAQLAAYETSRIVRERADARKDAEWQATAADNRRRLFLLLLLPLVPGIAVCLAGIALPVLLVVGALLLIAAASASWLTWSRLTEAALRSLAGLTPEEAVRAGSVTAIAVHRYVDLTEQLCTSLGVAMPRLRILDEAAPNAVSAGRGQGRGQAAVWVTAGLLAQLNRIELEAALAHELAHVKRLDIIAVAFELCWLGRLMLGMGGGARLAAWLEGPGREEAADLAGVLVTRYPPALLSTLEGMAARQPGTAAEMAPSFRAGATHTGRSWLAPLRAGATGAGLADRIDVLREL
ncbi:MAG: M48 family metalloprotease [Acidimicrobiales bacterium]